MNPSCHTSLGWTNAGRVAKAAGGYLAAGCSETVFTGVSIDSRAIRGGELFIALVGKRFDGHHFVSDALRKGAAGAIVSRRLSMTPSSNGVAMIMVEDTTEALQNVAAWHRRRFHVPVVAITGSNGKTTTKDLTWAILSRRWDTIRTLDSKNNHIGLPLTLLELDEHSEMAVLELGMSGFGEIRTLATICSPEVGCITNIGPSHLEFLGSVGNVAKAKSELLEEMRPGCPVVLNADDDWYGWHCERARGPVVSFGIRRRADFMAEEIRADNGVVSFRLVANFPGGRRRVRIPFPGEHNAYNALAAAAIASQLGAGPADIEEGLAEATLPRMRYEVMRVSGVTIINDAYNANPASMMCSLSSFCEMDVDGRRIFVCGNMLELGERATELHRQVGSFIRGRPIDCVITLGHLAQSVAEAAFEEEPGQGQSICCQTVEEVVSVLRRDLVPGDAVLIKGSRANGMERIVEALIDLERAASRKGVNHEC